MKFDRPSWAGLDTDLADFYDWGYWEPIAPGVVGRKMKTYGVKMRNHLASIMKIDGKFYGEVYGKTLGPYPTALDVQCVLNAVAWRRAGWATVCKRCQELGLVSHSDRYCKEYAHMTTHKEPLGYWDRLRKAGVIAIPLSRDALASGDLA